MFNVLYVGLMLQDCIDAYLCLLEDHYSIDYCHTNEE